LKISVEVEPPHGIFTSEKQSNKTIEDEINEYLPYVELISVTNRPVFGLSAITMAKRIQKHILMLNKTMRISLHLTTRLSHFDTFRTILDAERMGLSDLLPVLGDPRGPKDENYFDNGFDILGFTAYLKTGKTNQLSEKYQLLLQQGKLVPPIDNAKYKVGSVIDLNPVKVLKNGKKINIREKQIQFAKKKEELGAEYLISQAIYDPQYYLDFISESDINIPIAVGILPARNRLIDLFGIPINPLYKTQLRSQFTSKEEKIMGNKITMEVVNQLKDEGVKWIHIYSISDPLNFKQILGIEDIIQSQDRTNYQGINQIQD